jgi:hypothetical protein
MKMLLLIFLTSFSLLAQKEETPQVYKVDNEKARFLIEQQSQLGPNKIQFVQDGNGNYIIGQEVLSDPVYTFQKVYKGETIQSLRTKISTEATKENIALPSELNIAELIKQYGVLIEYVPVVDSLEVETKTIIKR